MFRVGVWGMISENVCGAGSRCDALCSTMERVVAGACVDACVSFGATAPLALPTTEVGACE
jgi:hypothetical protein